ncbi:MAG: FkbM family methyltransferase [Nanobdellota archaeon]
MSYFTTSINNKNIYFTTEDEYSKGWFYPRYKGGGVHERKVVELVLECCKRENVFFDIGAHLGFFTCVAGSVLPHISVHGFEMEKNAFRLLEKNVNFNSLSNVSLHNCAVSDTNENLFYEKSNLPCEKTAPKTEGNCLVQTIAVRLDSLSVLPNVLKIDVEGFELQVLKGMSGIINKVKAIFIEIHPNLYDKSTAAEILRLLKGFRVYEICDHRRRADADLIKVSSPDFPYNNMLYAFRR